ncbi:hypothetical protein VXS02_14600 [Photobacterium piscicola]|uniref:hypothetical protein n=1 Tax=Photobacterium piscicola TaxID=1378299 RepID=UPI002E18CFBB|nr:hypothetical protein [Photobacterium piscicola]
MCDSLDELQESHIIPRSIFKSLKRKSGQLAKVNGVSGVPLIKENSDLKELLLCKNCEQFLSANYEQYGTRLFKNPNGVTKKENHIEFSDFEYEKYYLYLISILWRASVSTLDEYSEVWLPSELSDILKDCVKNKTVHINENLRIDNFLRVSVFRLVDNTGTLTDQIIKGILTTIICTKNSIGETEYYFSVDGFLIKYTFTVGKNELDVQTSKNIGQLDNATVLKVLKKEVTDFPELTDLFKNLIKKAKSRSTNI